jgi:phage terminase small subunit
VKLKERLFIKYYLGRAKGNATLAAQLAGYGSNANSSHVLGSRLLRKVTIREAIDAKLDKATMPDEEILARLAERAASSAEDFLTFSKDAAPDTLPRLDLRRARRKGKLGNIKKIKSTRSGDDDPHEVTEVEIHDALPALALLARIRGLGETKETAGIAAVHERMTQYIDPDEPLLGSE